MTFIRIFRFISCFLGLQVKRCWQPCCIAIYLTQLYTGLPTLTDFPRVSRFESISHALTGRSGKASPGAYPGFGNKGGAEVGAKRRKF